MQLAQALPRPTLSISSGALRRRGATLGAGVLAGVAAFGLCYALVHLFVGGEIDDFYLMGRVLGRNDTGEWVGVGWILYEAHGVRLSLSHTPFGADLLSILRTYGLIVLTPREFAYGIPNDQFLLVRAIPPLVLGTVGAVLGYVGRPTVRRATVRGAAIAVGYLPAALAGWWLFRIGANTREVSPEPVLALLLVGIAYPVVCGGLGATVAAVVRSVVRRR